MKADETQYQQILGDLLAGLTVTPLEALNRYGCMRLAAVIHRLREDGHKVETEIITTPTGKHVARYSLANAPFQQPELPFKEA